MIISPWILLRLRNVEDKMRRECQNTHLLSNNFIFFGKSAVYDVMKKNRVQSDRPQINVAHEDAPCVPDE